jgi:hypothetical protein
VSPGRIAPHCGACPVEDSRLPLPCVSFLPLTRLPTGCQSRPYHLRCRRSRAPRSHLTMSRNFGRLDAARKKQRAHRHAQEMPGTQRNGFNGHGQLADCGQVDERLAQRVARAKLASRQRSRCRSYARTSVRPARTSTTT